MEKLKVFLSSVPLPVWIVGFLIVGVFFYWTSDDIGAWWEKRTQEKVDKAIAEKQVKIDELTAQRDAALQKSAEAVLREQAKETQFDILKQEFAKRNIAIDDAQKKIDAAGKVYTENLEYIDKYKNGEVTNLDFCLAQCKQSAQIGYPCRANYCDRFK